MKQEEGKGAVRKILKSVNNNRETQMEINETLKSIRGKTIHVEEKGDPLDRSLVAPRKQTEEMP